MTIFYTGIGSRSTPPLIQVSMMVQAKSCALRNFVLRSGGAAGADTAFENGADRKEIYIPWAGFNGPSSPSMSRIVSGDHAEARAIAKQFHPAWDQCSEGAKKLHTRNVHQVLGRDLIEPSAFVICWTPNGSSKGGTGQALRIARHWTIPIFDLGHPHINLKTLDTLIESLTEDAA